MRIPLTLDIERAKPDEPSDDQIADVSPGLIERAPHQPLGFTAAPGRIDDY